jgi:hypothetical protein
MRKTATRSKGEYSEHRLRGLRASAGARKQHTVQRLSQAIETLKARKQAITAQRIYEECGLHYASYSRNAEALALFRANSAHLTRKRQRYKRQSKAEGETSPQQRDPLMNYKKPQLVIRLRAAMLQVQELELQRANLVDACLQCEARVAELEASLAELEPYRSFVEQIRRRIQQEEHKEDGTTS